MTSDRRARGFTLLEMLVVLLIAGMALALTSQALSQYRRAHERVRAGYRALAAAEPARFAVIDAAPGPDAVAEAVWGVVAKKL